MQLMAHMLPGGKVIAADNTAEYGETTIKVTDPETLLFADTPEEQTVLMSHGDKIEAIPDGFKVAATSEQTPFAAMEDREHNFYGVQFHPEVRQTETV
ncbi:GMP synthase [glutamine-hydrolyzing] [Weissella viridescens]|uniref:Glutamine amidotransferase n=1 Tax=Weissella viridescens TaxID=1629 RepID=A0A380NWH2_WEIVI|nr:GMP synthase [glutamine-hydrolyzing] [Weissella viridescens]